MSVIKTENLEIGYKNKSLLEKINLKIDQRQIIAVLGSNGTGKSTLLKTLAGILKKIDGEILINGKKIETFPKKSLAKIIAFYDNSTPFFPYITAEEFIALGGYPHSKFLSFKNPVDSRKLYEVLNLLKINHLKERYIFEMSSGERQLVSLARIFFQNSDIFILDEPLTFLDIKNKFLVLEVFEYFVRQGKTIIFSTHDIRLALKNSDKIWLLKHNRIFCDIPEQLGLNKVFDTFFDNENIIFNFRELDFELKPGKASRKIAVKFIDTAEEVKFWTLFLLKRLNFSIEKNARLILSVSNNKWVLQAGNQTFTAQNLGELEKLLKNSI